MATRYYEFTGPLKWAKVWPGQVDKKYALNNPKGGHWSVVVNLQGDELLKYNALGCKSKAARLDDPERKIQKGDITFRRHEFKNSGEALGPPKVTGVEDGTSIGNGSVGTVFVEVYDYPAPDGTRGFASRLIGVDVTEFIPYVKPSNDGPPV